MQTYSLKDISMMTGYTTRTLRSYISSGLLKGTCDNRKWIFTEADFDEFISNRFIMDGIKIKCNVQIKQFMQSMKRDHSQACFVYDLPGSMEEVECICKTLIAYLSDNENAIVTFSFYYDEPCKVGRFVFIGDLSQIDGVIKNIMDRKK